jgi:hypothetical protein
MAAPIHKPLLVALLVVLWTPPLLARGPQRLARLTEPDLGTWAQSLDRLLQHPSLAPGRPSHDSAAARTRYLDNVTRSFAERGARPCRDGRVWSDVVDIWERLRPIIRDTYGVDMPVRVQLLAGGGVTAAARALPDGSVLLHRNDVEYCRSVARAVAAAGTDRAALLRNLATVARSTQQGKCRVTFGRTDRRLYRAALEGALVSLLGHEMSHYAAAHPMLTYSTQPRALRDEAELASRLKRYFPARTRRACSLDDVVQGRPLLIAQAQEADADRAAVDLAVAARVSADGLMAELVVQAMLGGLREQPVGSHPPGLYRLDDSRSRLRKHGLTSLADDLTRRDLAVALREARRGLIVLSPR